MTSDEILKFCLTKKLLVTHVTARPGCITVWLAQRPASEQRTMEKWFAGKSLVLTSFGWHHKDGHYLWLREQEAA